jgi:hypothetical protein
MKMYKLVSLKNFYTHEAGVKVINFMVFNSILQNSFLAFLILYNKLTTRIHALCTECFFQFCAVCQHMLFWQTNRMRHPFPLSFTYLFNSSLTRGLPYRYNQGLLWSGEDEVFKQPLKHLARQQQEWTSVLNRSTRIPNQFLAILHTLLLTPWNTVLLEKQTVAQWIKKFPRLLWNIELPWPRLQDPPLASILSYMSPIHISTPHFFKWNLILSSNLRLGISTIYGSRRLNKIFRHRHRFLSQLMNPVHIVTFK